MRSPKLLPFTLCLLVVATFWAAPAQAAPPSAPTGCHVDSTYAQSAYVKCDAAAGADSYHVVWDTSSHLTMAGYTDGGNDWPGDVYCDATAAYSLDACNANGLEPSTTFHFRVTAGNGDGDSDPSDDFTTTTVNDPAAPTGCTATSTSDTSLHVACTTFDGATGEAYAMSNVGDYLSCKFGCDFTGLTTGVSYQFVMTPFSGGGCDVQCTSGADSAEFSGTPGGDPPPTPTPPTPPYNPGTAAESLSAPLMALVVILAGSVGVIFLGLLLYTMMGNVGGLVGGRGK